MTIHSSRTVFSGPISIFNGPAKVIRWVSPNEVFSVPLQQEVVIPLVVKEFNLPKATITYLSGDMPEGLSIVDDSLQGNIDLEKSRVFEFTLRAESEGVIADRDFKLVAIGDDYEFRWFTPAGLVDAEYEGNPSTIVFDARDSLNLPVAFTRVAGPLPTGTQLDPATGALLGTYAEGDGDRQFVFTLQADNGLQQITREFMIFVWDAAGLGAPDWVTPKGPIADLYEGQTIDQYVEAMLSIDPNTPVQYTIEYGSPPTGSTFVEADGHFFGLLSEVEDDNRHRIIVSASADNGRSSSKRMFEILVRQNWPPEWPDGEIAFTEVEGYPFDDAWLQATDRNEPDQSITYLFVSGEFPNTMTFDPYTGEITGIAPPNDNEDGEPEEFFVVIRAHDSLKYTDKEVKIVSLKNVPPTFGTIPAGGDGIADDSGTGLTPDSRLNYVGLENTFLATRAHPATDRHNKPLTYSITGGALPTGWTFDPTTGVASGTLPPAPIEDLHFDFVISAANIKYTTNQYVRVTSWFNTDPVILTTTIPYGLEGKVYGATITGKDRERQRVTFRMVGGNMPSTLNMDQNGRITGILPYVPTGQLEEDFTLVVEASDGIRTSTETFILKNTKNVPPVWVTQTDLGGELGQRQFSAQVEAVDPNGQEVYYQLLEVTRTANGVTTVVNKPDMEYWNFNRNTGRLSGRFPHTYLSGDVVYTIKVAALDGDHPYQLHPSVIRTFTFTAYENLYPVWNTAEDFHTGKENTPIHKTISGYDPEGMPVIYYRQNGLINRSGFGSTARQINLIGNTVVGDLPVSVDRDLHIFFGVALDDQTRGNPYYYRTNRSFKITVEYDKPPVFLNQTLLSKRVEDTDFSFQIRTTNLGNAQTMQIAVTDGQLPPGLTMTPDGLISGRLPMVGNADVTYSFELTADNTTKTASKWFDIIVENNLAPYWVTPAGSVGSFYANNQITVPLTAVDPNDLRGNPMTFSAVGLPSGLSINSRTGAITGKLPLQEFATTYTFDATVTDGMYSDTRTFTITSVDNEAPVFLSPDILGTPYDNAAVNISIRARDAENEPLNTFALANGTSLPNGLTLSSSGVITGTTDDMVQDTFYSFDVSVSDSYQTTTKTFQIGIINNLPPVWVEPQQDQRYTIIAGNTETIDLDAIDPNGDRVDYVILDAGGAGEMARVSNAGSLGVSTLTFSTKREAVPQIYNIVLGAKDSYFMVPRRIIVEVLENNAPVFTTPAGILLTAHVNDTVSYQIVAADDNGLPLTYSISGGNLPAGLSIDPNTGEISGTIDYIEPEVFFFTIQINDGHWDTYQSYQIEVLNDEPVWVTDYDLGVHTEHGMIDIQLDAFDPEGAPVTYELVGTSQPDLEDVDNNILLVAPNFTLTSQGRLQGTIPTVMRSGYIYVNVDAFDGKVKAPRSFFLFINFNSPPIWLTESDLPDDTEQYPYSAKLLSVANDQLITYQVVGGDFPSSLTLASDGEITGTLPVINGDTTFNFTVEAKAADGKISERVFNLLVYENIAPVWKTAAEQPDIEFGTTNFSLNFEALDPNGKDITYNLVSGTPPFPIDFGSNGEYALMTGNLPALTADRQYEFTIGANDGFISTERVFRIKGLMNRPPVWQHADGHVFQIREGEASRFYLFAKDEKRDITYSIISDNFPTHPVTGQKMISLTDVKSGRVDANVSPVYGDEYFDFVAMADDGEKTSTINLRVKVVNDNALYDPHSNAVVFLAPADNVSVFDVMSNKTLAFNGTATNSSAKARWGRSYFGATGITTPSYAEFNGGADFAIHSIPEWTVDMWLYQEVTGGTQIPFAIGDVDGNWAGIELVSDNVTFKVATGGGALSYSIMLGKITEQRWFHVEISRDSDNTIRCFLNGVLVDSRENSMIGTLGSTVRFAGCGDPLRNWQGYVDELRMTHAVRHTEDFAASNRAPYPPRFTSSNNILVAAGQELTVPTSVINATGEKRDPDAETSVRFHVYDNPAFSIDNNGYLVFDKFPVALGATTDHNVKISVLDSNGNLSVPHTVRVRSTAAWLDGLVAQWRLQQDDDVTLSISPMAKIGSGVVKDGYVEMDNEVVYMSTVLAAMSEDFTVEAWINSEDHSDGSALNIGSFVQIGYADGQFALLGTNLRGTIKDGWNHVAVERKGSRVVFYVNGRAVGNITSAPTTVTDNDVTFNSRQISTQYRGVSLWSVVRFDGDFKAEYPNFGEEEGQVKWLSDENLGGFDRLQTINLRLNYRDSMNKVTAVSLTDDLPRGLAFSAEDVSIEGIIIGDAGEVVRFTAVLETPAGPVEREFFYTIKTPIPPVEWMTEPDLGELSMGQGAAIRMIAKQNP